MVVKSIVKEEYDGKIYDVDVPNDIVLVRGVDDELTLNENTLTEK